MKEWDAIKIAVVELGHFVSLLSNLSFPVMLRLSIFADCSVCQKGYAASSVYTCTKCSDWSRAVALGVVIVVVILLVALMAVFVAFVASAKSVDSWRKLFSNKLLRALPLQSIKILVVVWQILTQVRYSGMSYL